MIKGYTAYVLDFFRLYEMDVENIQKGYYRQPYDLDPQSKQYDPKWVLSQLRRARKVGIETIQRRDRKGWNELPFSSDLYPEYYLRNFHYQTDGWLSSDSAKVYEFQTETLFLGAQDAMQRQVFVPTHFWMQKPENKARKQDSFKVLEVAGGTGRLMTFFRDNYPQMDATFLELSPFYLEEARKNDATFRKYFKRSDPRANNVEMTPLKLVQGKAEKTTFEDESFDIVNCVYLFHELPPEVRREVAKEMFRVLRPGGLVAWNDSIQAKDRDQFDKEVLSAFPKRYHEPFYMNYIEDDIDAIFEEAGFVKGPVGPIIANRSKAMCWTKPGTFEATPEMLRTDTETWSEEQFKSVTAAEGIQDKIKTRVKNRNDYIEMKTKKIADKLNEKITGKKKDEEEEKDTSDEKHTVDSASPSDEVINKGESYAESVAATVPVGDKKDETVEPIIVAIADEVEDKLDMALDMTEKTVAEVKDMTEKTVAAV